MGNPKKSMEYVKTGIPGFDNLLKHGIPKGSSVLVAGGPGTGKTIFCLQVCNYAITHGEKCLYMSFEEPEERLREHMRSFGWEPETYEKKGTLLIKRYDPFDITRSVEALLTKAKKELLIEIEPVFFPEGFKPTKVVLDSMSAVAAAFVGRDDSYRIYIEQLFRFFEKIDVTSFLITEVENPDTMGLTRSGVEGFLADGIILMHSLKSDGVRTNGIEILKIRGEDFAKKIVEMKIIDGKGIIVDPNKVLKLSRI